MGVLNYIKQVLLNNKPWIPSTQAPEIEGDFNTPCSPMDRSSDKIKRQTLEISESIDHWEPTYIHRIFYANITEHTFFSAVMEVSLKFVIY